ncbi:MAG: hypothetical protein WCB85_07910 [Candidatus Dormiibacterota bacterium]
MTRNGQGQGPRPRGGDNPRRGGRSLAAQWRLASTGRDRDTAAPAATWGETRLLRSHLTPTAPASAEARADEGADFVRQAIQGIFQ